MYLSAVRFLQISEGKGDPFVLPLQRLHYILQGVKRQEARQGGREEGEVASLSEHLEEDESGMAGREREPGHKNAVGGSMLGILWVS